MKTFADVRRTLPRAAWWIACLCVSLLVLYPIYVMVSQSLKSSAESTSNPPTLYPHAFSIDNYRSLGNISAMARVMLPVAIPGLISTALFTFFTSWNEFFAALILVTDEAKFTLPVTLTVLASNQLGTLNWGIMQAGVAVTAVPCIVLYLLLQRYYVAGLVAGAVK